MVKNLSAKFTLGGCVFGAVKLTKNTQLEKYGYNDYGIGFDTCPQFSLPSCDLGKNVVSFGVDNSLSPRVNTRKK